MPLPDDPEADAFPLSSITGPTAPGSIEWRALTRHRRRELAAEWGVDPELVFLPDSVEPPKPAQRKKKA